MKKNRIITMGLREIKKSKKRFFSLCILSILGVSFYVGMKMAGPTMIETLDKYYDDHKIYDLKIISTLGLNDEDIKEIKKLNKKYVVEGSHTKDAIFNDGEHESVIRIHEIDEELNNIIITDGRLPEKYNEIVVEDGIIDKTNYKIGDKIKLELEDDDDDLRSNVLEIVGIVLSPEYVNNNQVSQSRGNTSLGNGQVAFYSYASKDLFNLDYYTEIYVKDNDATKYITTKEDYLNKIEKDIDQLDTIKETRQKDRYEKLKEEADNKLMKEEEKAYTELNKAEEELKQFKIELDSGKNKLDSAKIELDNANIEIEQGKINLEKAKEELKNGKQKLIDGKNKIEDEIKDYDITYDKLSEFIKKYDNSSFSITDLIKIFGDENIDVNEVIDSSIVNIKDIASLYGIDFNSLLDQYGITAEYLKEKADVKINELLDVITINQLKELIIDDNFIILIKGSIPSDFIFYDETIYYLDEYLNNKNNIVDLFQGIRDIENGYIEYNNSSNLITEKENELNNAYAQYEIGIYEYNNGLNEYNTNLDLYNKSIIEFEENKTKIKEEIELAREKIQKMENAIWFIQTREDNNEYITYLSSYNSIERLSNIFPIIFFIVSIIISILSMTRMAIEDRNEIGTLKALGFTNNDIRLKFIIYSLLATLIGGIIGAIEGYTIIPKIIVEVFKIMHFIPITIYSTNFMPIIIGLIISIICIVGSTIVSINNLVREKATTLLRPMAPLIGKKIFIEKISFIWNKLKYKNKLTIRNIFRFKRRILMSLFGIASCTMILLAGYGIKDSISYVVDKQYNEINHNDGLIYLDGKLNKEELDKTVDNKDVDFNVYARIDQVKIGNKRLSLIIPYDNNEFKKALTIIDIDTNKETNIKENEVILTGKLAEYFNKKVGDTISILENDNLTYDFTISSICENYIGDYVYMSKNTYENNIGEYKINAEYIKYKDINKENEVLSNIKKNNSHILSTISIVNVKKQADILFKSLNLIIYVLIMFSGALSFVVFYSLAYINISERQREIATLKVLGFYNKEVDNYIMREEIIITILGILLGLVFGTLYTYQLIDSIEINTMQYIKSIHLDSYIMTFIFMIIFTIIVSIGVHITLKKINFIESLKSVE